MAEFSGGPGSDFLEGTNENDTFGDFLGLGLITSRQ
jgi:hypothetical protein